MANPTPTQIRAAAVVKRWLEFKAQPITLGEFQEMWKPTPDDERKKMAQDAINSLNNAGAPDAPFVLIE